MTKAIDVWVNPFTPEIIDRDWKGALLQASRAEDVMGIEKRLQGFTPEEYVAYMDEAGVEMSFVPSFKMGMWPYYPHLARVLMWDVSVKEVCDIVNKFPDRLRGLYGINPRRGMEAVREMEMVVKEFGFIGAHSHVFPFGPFNDKMWYPFYTKCCELDIPIISQIGHSGEQMPSANARPILIDDVALDFAELKIVAAHTGWPWVEELIAMAWKHPNVYIATTAHMPRYWDQSLVRFINTRGQNKVMWGSDWPITMPKENLIQVKELNLREEPQKKFLRENAIRVYKLDI